MKKKQRLKPQSIQPIKRTLSRVRNFSQSLRFISPTAHRVKNKTQLKGSQKEPGMLSVDMPFLREKVFQYSMHMVMNIGPLP